MQITNIFTDSSGNKLIAFRSVINVKGGKPYFGHVYFADFAENNVLRLFSGDSYTAIQFLSFTQALRYIFSL